MGVQLYRSTRGEYTCFRVLLYSIQLDITPLGGGVHVLKEAVSMYENGGCPCMTLRVSFYEDPLKPNPNPNGFVSVLPRGNILTKELWSYVTSKSLGL